MILMKTSNRSTTALIISALAFVLIAVFASQPVTMSLNKSIGWESGSSDYNYWDNGIVNLFSRSISLGYGLEEDHLAECD